MITLSVETAPIQVSVAPSAGPAVVVTMPPLLSVSASLVGMQGPQGPEADLEPLWDAIGDTDGPSPVLIFENGLI